MRLTTNTIPMKTITIVFWASHFGRWTASSTITEQENDTRSKGRIINVRASTNQWTWTICNDLFDT